MIDWLYANRLALFGIVEWWNFVLSLIGATIGAITWIESRITYQARVRDQSGPILLLIAARGARVARNLCTAMTAFSLFFAFAIIEPPTAGQLDPSAQVVLFYLVMPTIVGILTYTKIRNYIDFRKLNWLYEDGLRQSAPRPPDTILAALTAAQPIDVHIVPEATQERVE